MPRTSARALPVEHLGGSSVQDLAPKVEVKPAPTGAVMAYPAAVDEHGVWVCSYKF